MGTLSNIKIEPMNCTWGEEVSQIETITCVADVADSLDGNYFFIYSTAGVKHHVWFNTSGGAATDPAPGGSTAQVVAITTGATAAAVATALEVVLEAIAGLTCTVSDNVVTVTHDAAGYIQPAFDVDSGFSFGVTTAGDNAVDVGYIDGDIEVSTAEDLVDVTSEQNGTNVLSQIRTGKQVELVLNLQESSVAQMKRVLRQGGGAFTPVGANGTEVVGWGQSSDFSQTILQAKKLVLHPVVLGSSDKSRDMTFQLAYPMLETLTFSGENKFVIPVTFKCYPKTSLNSRVQYFAFGDGSQTMT